MATPLLVFSFEKNYLFGNPSSVNIAISSSSRIVNCLYIIFGPDVPVAQQRSGRKEPRLEAFELRCLPSLYSLHTSAAVPPPPPRSLSSFFFFTLKRKRDLEKGTLIDTWSLKLEQYSIYCCVVVVAWCMLMWIQSRRVTRAKNKERKKKPLPKQSVYR